MASKSIQHIHSSVFHYFGEGVYVVSTNWKVCLAVCFSVKFYLLK